MKQRSTERIIPPELSFTGEIKLTSAAKADVIMDHTIHTTELFKSSPASLIFVSFIMLLGFFEFIDKYHHTRLHVLQLISYLS